MELWTVRTGHNLGTIQEGVTQSLPLPVQNNPTLTLISGSLPGGLRIENGRLEGTPFEVARAETSSFCIRATSGVFKQDRTLTITVEGMDAPQWVTPEGSLGAGPNTKAYVLDSSIVDFKLEVLDPDLKAGENLEFWIASEDGQLPPGLRLTTDGKIVGAVEPILALEKRANTGFYDTNTYGEFPFDFGVKSSNGFDSYFYDTTFYDFNTPTRSPKKLNRYYEFIVSVSDGTTVAKRKFQLYLVGDDFLRTDNTILQVGSGLFTADNTNLRKPVWLTPGDLGFRRADNYVTLFLDTYDPATTTGVISYLLEQTNDDGSESTLPPGLALDSTTGEIAGRVPYQPAVTREYKFTINAIRQIADIDYAETQFDLYEDEPVLGGTKFVNITKVINLETLISLPRLSTKSQTYANVLTGTQSNDFDTLELTEPLKSPTYFLATADNLTGAGRIKVYNPTSTNIAGVYYDGQTSHKFQGLTVVNEGGIDYGIINIDGVLAQDIPEYTKIYYGTVIPRGTTFFVQTTDSEADIVESKKTFTVKMLGDVESTIQWLTAEDLGTLRANFISTLGVKAQTNVPDGKLFYTLINGSLPPGLKLAIDGEIVGKITQFGTITNPGLTVFDNKTTSFDGASTTIDRKYTFTIRAQDQFGFSAIERTFSLSTIDPDDTLYSNLSMRPLMKQEKKSAFNQFISNPNIFTPASIYRPNDAQFGLQTDLKMLAYAGIETKEIENYIGAAGLNHKRKRFRFGEVKTAKATVSGSNETVYEVVYVEIIDPAEPTQGRARKSFKIANEETITVDSVELESKDDNSNLGLGGSGLDIQGRGATLNISTVGDSIVVTTREGETFIDTTGNVVVFSNDGSTQFASNNILDSGPSEPFRFRPNNNTIKADTQGVNASQSKDQFKYLTNITNMRSRVKQVGETEREFLPLWMRTQQTLGQGTLGFVPAVPLCYCKPGTSADILLNIKNSGFDFKTLDFDIDRYIIDSTKGNSQEQYIVFGNYDYNV
jgi:hypothetical protein